MIVNGVVVGVVRHRSLNDASLNERRGGTAGVCKKRGSGRGALLTSLVFAVCRGSDARRSCCCPQMCLSRGRMWRGKSLVDPRQCTSTGLTSSARRTSGITSRISTLYTSSGSMTRHVRARQNHSPISLLRLPPRTFSVPVPQSKHYFPLLSTPSLEPLAILTFVDTALGPHCHVAAASHSRECICCWIAFTRQCRV